MKRDLRAAITDIKTGKGTRCLLLFGDDLQVQDTCKMIIDFLVPEGHRGFNLERYDGRSTPWEQAQVSLMTPPFFPGTKVLWLENVPYFISREQKTELGERILELWSDGKQDEACKLLLDALVVEGWTQKQWDELPAQATPELVRLLGVEGAEGREQIDAILAYGKTQEIDLSRRRGAESHGLAELLESGLPEWSFLLLTAVQVDRRTRLYKRLDDLGAAFYLGLERERGGRLNREQLVQFVEQRMRQAGKAMDTRVRDIIVQRAPADLRTLGHELEKLFLFAGERSAIRPEEVELLFTDHGDGWVFDLTRAIGERDPRGALSQLARLIARGEHPLKLLAVIASEARRLLAARQSLDAELRGRWRPAMSYPQFQQQVLSRGTAGPARNSYGDYMCLLRAERLSMGELRRYMTAIHDADARLKSTGSNPRLVMERLILGMCLGDRKRAAAGAVK